MGKSQDEKIVQILTLHLFCKSFTNFDLIIEGWHWAFTLYMYKPPKLWTITVATYSFKLQGFVEEPLMSVFDLTFTDPSQVVRSLQSGALTLDIAICIRNCITYTAAFVRCITSMLIVVPAVPKTLPCAIFSSFFRVKCGPVTSATACHNSTSRFLRTMRV